ncbi:MAG TPA: N-6 DNA methylase, partial [Polyangiaceae bacterium]
NPARGERRELRERARQLLGAALEEWERIQGRSRGRFDDAKLWELLAAVVMSHGVESCAALLGISEPRRRQLRELFQRTCALGGSPVSRSFRRMRIKLIHQFGPLQVSIDGLGEMYESLLELGLARDRRRRPTLLPGHGRHLSGSFYTPRDLTHQVVSTAMQPLLERAVTAGSPELLLSLRVCDPAMGAGAFLLEACRQLAEALAVFREQLGLPREGVAGLRRVAENCIYGVDLSPLAVSLARASVWLLVGDESLPVRAVAEKLLPGDALNEASFNWTRSFPEVSARGGFDVVIGNPPWVAYAGRAARPLDPKLRAHYARRFRGFRGYPTLHALFIERAAELAPRGTVALLVPSPVADLDGYRAVRCVLTRTHALREPLLEFGQDAFVNVTQPCFALIADASSAATESDQPWKLRERQRALSAAEPLAPPRALVQLTDMPRFPRALFGEMGFQTTRRATMKLCLRASAPDARHRYPLLQGRDVSEFREGGARLYLCADPERVRWAGCRLRPESDYRRVRFVVRQTACVPIAALHGGLPFRNTLLAGFEVDGLCPELVVGLLNSALYRACHVASQRDARQAVFPQVKVGHLRSLPRPPEKSALVSQIVKLTLCATHSGIDSELFRELDRAVFDLFDLSGPERDEVQNFVFKHVRRQRVSGVGG